MENKNNKNERHFRLERIYPIQKEVSATGASIKLPNQFGTEPSYDNNDITNNQKSQISLPSEYNMQQNISNDPIVLARLFTYFLYQKKAKDYVVNFVNVSGKTTYSKSKKIFDLLSKLCEKYSIDGKDYIRFSIYNEGVNFYNISIIFFFLNV